MVQNSNIYHPLVGRDFEILCKFNLKRVKYMYTFVGFNPTKARLFQPYQVLEGGAKSYSGFRLTFLVLIGPQSSGQAWNSSEMMSGYQ